MATILKLLGLDEVGVNKTHYPQHLPVGGVVDDELVFGCELEIENVPNWDRLEIALVGSTNDGSLRNNGREFLLRPQKYLDAVATLTEFFRRANLNETNYSDRTSIHVHTNCQDLTIDELQIILFNYQIVESLLFGWLNSGREDNIFCVPWSQTNLSYQMFDGHRDIRKFKQWAKYTALNLLPLYELGTIEWRHMEGHCNPAKLFKWMQIISCFYRYARNNKIDAVKESLMALNTTSHYGQYVESVFQEHSDFIYTQPNWQRQLEDGVLLMKYAMTPSKPEEKAKKTVAGSASASGSFTSNVMGHDDFPADQPVNITTTATTTALNRRRPGDHLDTQALMARVAEEHRILRTMEQRNATIRNDEPRPIARPRRNP